MAAARKPSLRIAEPGETTPKPTSVAEAAVVGDELGMLRFTRKRIATAIDCERTPARDLAALSKRLMEVQQQISEIEERDREKGGSDVIDDAPFDPASL